MLPRSARDFKAAVTGAPRWPGRARAARRGRTGRPEGVILGRGFSRSCRETYRRRRRVGLEAGCLHRPVTNGAAMTKTESPTSPDEPGVPATDMPPVVAVANRLPVQQGDDGWQLSPGGLVTALRPVMAAQTGAWVGWDGGTRNMPTSLPGMGVRLRPLSLSARLVR